MNKIRGFMWVGMMAATLLCNAMPVAVDSLQIKSRLLVQKGDSCERQYNTFAALGLFEKAMQLTPTPVVFRRVAQCHYKRGHYREGLSVNNRIPADSISHQDMKFRYNCYANINKVDSAVWWAKEIVAKYPYDSDIVANLAQYYIGDDKPELAVQCCKNYQEIDTANVFVNRQLAYGYYSMKNYLYALREYKKLIEQDDRSFLTLYCTGLCYAQVEIVPQKAYDYLLEAVKLKEYKHPNSLSHLGMLCIEMHLAEEGIGYLKTALELTQPDPMLLFALYNSMANGYLYQLDYANSLRCLRECVRNNPKSAYTLFKIAQIYGYQKDVVHEKQTYQAFLDKCEKLPQKSDAIVAAIKSAESRLREIKEEAFFKQGTK